MSSGNARGDAARASSHLYYDAVRRVLGDERTKNLERMPMTTLEDLFDVRVIERNLSRGVVSPKDYEKHLATLRDVAANAEYVADASGDDDDEASDEG
jgi:hypothetical protein